MLMIERQIIFLVKLSPNAVHGEVQKKKKKILSIINLPLFTRLFCYMYYSSYKILLFIIISQLGS